jgi:hypothetical protein
MGTSCIPAGACTSQVGNQGMTVCYANGLTYVNAISGSGSAATSVLTVSNGSTRCFTGTASAAAQTGTTVTFSLQNPAGTTIATLTQDTSTGQATVTCLGGQSVALNAACSGGTGCSLGTCP